MTTRHHLRIFISSPSDVPDERGKAFNVIHSLNRQIGEVYNITLESVAWEKHVAPDMGKAQAIINKQIGDYDIFVGIMWKRFGTKTDTADSGTEEEFNIAYKNWQAYQRPHILFYFCNKPYAPSSIEELDQWRRVIGFKNDIGKKGLYGEYQTSDDFQDLLRDHLINIIKERIKFRTDIIAPTNFTSYLKFLHSETMYMNIRGLASGEARAHQFLIDELYLPLKTGSMRENELKTTPHGHILLQEALREKRLVIKGEPGTGKTTFLRLLAYTLCQTWLGEGVKNNLDIHWPASPPLPLFIHLGRFTEFLQIGREKKKATLPDRDDSPECLLHYLNQLNREFNWGLPEHAFGKELKDGNCLILLDGLDEAPDSRIRKSISDLAANLIKTYPRCKVVLTSRPIALDDKTFPDAFGLVEIADLDERSIQDFIAKWTAALYAKAPEKAIQYRAELNDALRSRPEILRMAYTPVMLTALAVVHWNENRLPEQRAELYESVISWLLRSRESRAGRLKADRCRKLLQKLALSMFNHSNGRQRQVGLRWAAEQLESEFDLSIENSALERAEYFLRDEMLDSGIIVERHNRLEFWHLSFQEYLAAYEIAGKKDQQLQKILFIGERIYNPEWRELVLLLAGVLHKFGADKINSLVDGIIAKGPKRIQKTNLPQIAREVGLVGQMVRDLSPFDFKPTNPLYIKHMQNVMGIFDTKTFRSVPVQIRIAAANALGKAGDPRLPQDLRCALNWKLPRQVQDVEPYWVYIHGGPFLMGSQAQNKKGKNYDPEAEEWESPVHEVTLSEFFMGRYPVTVAQYERFILDDGYKNEKWWREGKSIIKYEEPENWQKQLAYPNRPVVGVSWFEAQAFCRWTGGRLPTEAEWERVARGAKGDYRKYPWGSDEPSKDITNCLNARINDITPVGIFPTDRSPEGVIEMAGNVLEWCLDWYDGEYYNSGKTQNPFGPSKGNSRVVRGGSFYYDADGIRCSARDLWNPINRYGQVGFRVVRGAQS